MTGNGRWVSLGAHYDIDPADVALYCCLPEVMTALMGELDANGGTAGWLREHGLADEELTRPRDGLTG